VGRIKIKSSFAVNCYGGQIRLKEVKCKGKVSLKDKVKKKHLPLAHSGTPPFLRLRSGTRREKLKFILTTDN